MLFFFLPVCSCSYQWFNDIIIQERKNTWYDLSLNHFLYTAFSTILIFHTSPFLITCIPLNIILQYKLYTCIYFCIFFFWIFLHSAFSTPSFSKLCIHSTPHYEFSTKPNMQGQSQSSSWNSTWKIFQKMVLKWFKRSFDDPQHSLVLEWQCSQHRWIQYCRPAQSQGKLGPERHGSLKFFCTDFRFRLKQWLWCVYVESWTKIIRGNW